MIQMIKSMQPKKIPKKKRKAANKLHKEHLMIFIRTRQNLRQKLKTKFIICKQQK